MKLSASDRRRLTKKLSSMQNRAPVERAVLESGEDLLTKSLEGTPKDDSDLRNSGEAKPVPGRGSVGPGVRVSFGGQAAPYAQIVHEMPQDDTNWTTPGTGSKYLESPYLANKKRYAEHIKQAARPNR